MKCLEVAAAALAEVLIQNGVNIDVETECIHWPIADIVTVPPTNVVNKGKDRGAKVPKKLISGKSGQVFGQIVNDIQAKKSACSGTDGNRDAGPSTSGDAVAAKTSTTGTSSEEIVSNQTSNTSNQKGNGLQTTQHVGLPVRVRNGIFLVRGIIYPGARII